MTKTTLYYAPQSRATTALWLLEELGVDYELRRINLKKADQKTPEFLALNPMGKVPLVVHEGTPVAETGAIAIYLSDLFPQAGLAPRADEPARADFLRWTFFSGSVMEPAFAQKMLGFEIPAMSVAWGSYDEMKRVLESAIAEGPYLLGERFSAADVVVGSTARFGVLFEWIQEGPIVDYVERLQARPALARALAKEAEIVQEMAASSAD